MRNEKEDADKICIEVHFNTKRFALNYAKDLRTTVKDRNRLKELRVRSGLLTHEKSNCPVSNIFMPLGAFPY